MKFFIFTMLSILSLPIYAKSKHERYKLEQINSLIRPLPQHRTFYHWAKARKARILTSHGAYSFARFQVTMHIGTKIDNLALHAGRGMYISERYDNCSKYGDTLIEVHASTGTPYLDLTDPNTKKAMKNLSITRRNVFTLNPNALIRFDVTHQWWVVKTRDGISFSEFRESNAVQLLRSRHKIIRKSDEDQYYSQSLPILRRNVVTLHNGIRELPEQKAQPSLQSADSQSLYMWRADSSCGWYTRRYELIQDDVPINFCRNQLATNYSWFSGKCRENVAGFPTIVVSPNVDRRLCPVRFRHKGQCAKLKGQDIIFIKESYCEKAGL